MEYNIFSDKLDVDDRAPIYTIGFHEQLYGLFAPKIMFWVQLKVGILLCSIFSMAMATIVFKGIIPRRGTTTSYLIGFGVVIPLAILWFPFWVLNLMEVRNKLLRFCISAIYPVLIMFRTSEAMYGFSPHSGIEIQFDKITKKAMKASLKDKVSSIEAFTFSILFLGLYQSIFGPCNFEPFLTNANGNNPGYDFKDLLDWRLLCNNFVGVILLQLYLSTFSSALNLLANVLLGFKVKISMKNPLMKATSPSDFWTGRWNLLIHGALKRGVFKPVYSMSSKGVAVLATFLASGLFHEYILVACHPEHLNFKPELGKNTAFMMWNGGVIMLEALVGHAHIFAWLRNSIPSPITTLLVLATAMPIGHWFLHPYTKSTLFHDGDICLFMVKVIE